MLPLGLFSLTETPEELLNRGYGYSDDIPFDDLPIDDQNLSTSFPDPAFGRLNTNVGYFSAPFTGARPFQNARFLRAYTTRDGTDFGFDADLYNPSFGGISGYRDSGGIMDIDTPIKNLGIDTSFGVANEPDVEQVETLEGKSFQEPTGIRKLFNFLSLFSPVGLITRGLGSLSGLNNRLRNTDFGLSKNLADFIDMKKYGGFEGRERARRRTMTEARDLQRAINRGDFNRDRSGITDRGRGDTSSAPSRPSRSAPSYEAAGRAFARGR